jgi:hypothetical protein
MGDFRHAYAEKLHAILSPINGLLPPDPDNKKPAGLGAAGLGSYFLTMWAVSDRFRHGGFEIGDANALAFGLHHVGATFEHAVEFIDHHGDGFMAFVGRDGGVHVGTVNLDVAFGGETLGDGLFRVAFKFNAHAYNSLLMTEQSFRFFLNEGFERRGQFEVDA